MSQVATKKPRICGYISEEILELVDEYMRVTQCSQSHAVENASTAFFGIGKQRMRKLIRLAEKERREPGSQATILLNQALDRIEE